MEVQKVFHVIEGEGDTSYASNSILQKTIILQAKPIIQDMIVRMYCKTFPQCLRIADMGCSSGTNSLLVLSEIIEAVDETCRNLERPSPEIQLFLNDLPGNDFNTIFKSIPKFYEELRKDKGEEFGPCFILGVPGSFYGRLFPIKSLNFVHSANSHHWLSQVPQGIENNKGNVHMAMTSPPNVFKAYLDQFSKDFSVFLSSRSKEMDVGGQMIITIVGRQSLDPSIKEFCDMWDMLANSLSDMVSRGLIEEGKLDSFNLPYYTPHLEEVKLIIQLEGSFVLDRLETFTVKWDGSEDDVDRDFGYDKLESGKCVAKTVRAVIESMVASHFGESIIDDLFSRFAELVGEYLVKKRPSLYNLVICMSKNDCNL